MVNQGLLVCPCSSIMCVRCVQAFYIYVHGSALWVSPPIFLCLFPAQPQDFREPSDSAMSAPLLLFPSQDHMAMRVTAPSL